MVILAIYVGYATLELKQYYIDIAAIPLFSAIHWVVSLVSLRIWTRTRHFYTLSRNILLFRARVFKNFIIVGAWTLAL